MRLELVAVAVGQDSNFFCLLRDQRPVTAKTCLFTFGVVVNKHA